MNHNPFIPQYKNSASQELAASSILRWADGCFSAPSTCDPAQESALSSAP
jgi:hypothetical protein